MDMFVFKVLRGAAIFLYLVASLAGFAMIIALGALTIDLLSGAALSAATPEFSLLVLVALAWTVIPATLGFALDRLAIIGTSAKA
jgi:hypothetical protein